MTDAILYSVPPEPGRWRAFTLAAVVHAALLAFLWFSVRWQSETPVAVEAEVWSPQVREAAPRPEPEVKPEVKEIPKPAVVEAPVARPDIALEQEKKRKEKEQKIRDETIRLEKQKAEQKRLEKEKIEAQKKRELDEAKKTKAEKQRQEQAEAKKLDEERAKEMRRIAGSTSGTGNTGDAEKRQGSRGDGEYGQKIGAKIKSNTVFNLSDSTPGNTPVEYAVELLPDGSIRRPIRKLKSSGIPGFDEAVLNAIEKSQPFPPDKSGQVPSSVTIVHKPKDQ
jgi:colicin import membrane protein